jgi:hypothetical protein
VAAVAAAGLSERDARHGVRRLRTRLVVFAAALVVGLAGHWGGLLAHGKDFFDG